MKEFLVRNKSNQNNELQDKKRSNLLTIHEIIPLGVIHYYVMFKLKQKKIFKTLFSNKTWSNFECLCAIVL